MATPFLDSLSAAQKATVAQKSRRENRPSYYDGTIAETTTRLQTTGAEDASQSPEVQISEDLEAMLILMSTKDKTDLLAFIGTAMKVASSLSNDDFALMTEVVGIRAAAYEQIKVDVGSQIKSYDAARANMSRFLEQTAYKSKEDTTSVLIPDLGILFDTLNDSYRLLVVPDALAVHDRIADTGVLYAYQNAATNRVKELSSWSAIVTLYLV